MEVSEELIKQFSECKDIRDDLRRQLAIGSILSKVFTDNGLEPPIIVGGAAVAVYTYGGYATMDLDMITSYREVVREILEAFNYKKQGKDYYNTKMGSYIEFPSGELAGDKERVSEYIVEETGLPVYIIGFEDIILDRIDGYKATNDSNSKEWALKLMGTLYSELDWSYLHRESAKRKTLDITNKLQRTVKRYKELYDLLKNKEEH